VARLALDVAAGAELLGIPGWHCKQGRVVIFDNELHERTMAYRLDAVRKACDYPQDLLYMIHPYCTRGENINLEGLGQHIYPSIKLAQPIVVVIDALYKYLPEKVSENDNAQMGKVYNLIDKYAGELNASFVIIHHMSKGNQAEKNVRDLGAGGGSINRAADSVMTLREHEMDNHYVMECLARSWPPPKPMVLESDFPSWIVKPDEDPSKLRRLGTVRPKLADHADPLTNAAFAVYLGTMNWKTRSEVIKDIAEQQQIKRMVAVQLVKSIIRRNDLDSLSRKDGLRDCSTFLVRKGSSGALEFKLVSNGLDSWSTNKG